MTRKIISGPLDALLTRLLYHHPMLCWMLLFVGIPVAVILVLVIGAALLFLLLSLMQEGF
jgi:hypothetical protein